MILNKSSNSINKILLILTTIFLVLIFFLGSFSGLFFDKGYYDKLYEKTGTYNRIEKDVVDEKTNEIFSFFKSNGELDQEFFTQNEISHMKDVRNLIKKFYLVYYLSLFFILLIVLIVYKYFKESLSLLLKKLLLYSGISTVVIVLLFFVFSFSNLFDNFHILFFAGNYTFPSSSNLIKLFNEQFFNLFAAKIIILGLIKGMIVGVLGGILIYKK